MDMLTEGWDKVSRKILIVAHYTILPGEGRNPRLVYLYDFLKKKGLDVSIITCDFSHNERIMRNTIKYKEEHEDYNIFFLHGYKYKKSVSIKRFMSQKKFANELKTWLRRNGNNYDAFYCPQPTSEATNVVEDYCANSNKKVIIDVRDIWPEAMKMFIKNDYLYTAIFGNYKKMVNKAYSRADAVVGVSEEYVSLALSVNKKSKDTAIVYQGVDVDEFDRGVAEFSSNIDKPKNEFWITYAGKLGESYDLNTVIDGVKELYNKGYTNLRFLILGKGPSEEKIRQHVSSSNAEAFVLFLGYKTYKEMAAYLNKSDVVVNALVKNSPQTIINKIGDYFASGTAVLSSSECDELKQMITTYKVGLNYKPENFKDFSDKLCTIYSNQNVREQYGVNARRLALDKFNRPTIYNQIYQLIMNI